MNFLKPLTLLTLQITCASAYQFIQPNKQKLYDAITIFGEKELDSLQNSESKNEKLELQRLQAISNRLAVTFINQTTDTDIEKLLSRLGVTNKNRKRRGISDPDSVFASIISFKDINNYGCWCKLAQPGKGWGSAMDSIDTACKSFQLCRKCIAIEDEGNSCSPLFTNYTIGEYFSGHDIANECLKANPTDSCASRVCSCEVQFVSQLMSVFFRLSDSYNQEFKHDTGFDPDESCQIWVTSPKQWECCGSFPEIMPYNTFDKYCCKNKMPYSPDYQLCCSNGGVEHYGDGCSSKTRKKRQVGPNLRDENLAWMDYVASVDFYGEM